MRSDNFKMKFNIARDETRLNEDYIASHVADLEKEAK